MDERVLCRGPKRRRGGHPPQVGHTLPIRTTGVTAMAPGSGIASAWIMRNRIPLHGVCR